MLRLLFRFNDSIFNTLAIAIALFAIVLASRYPITFDLTRESRNSLSERSEAVVSQLQQTATISLYAGHNPALLQTSKDLVSRYIHSSDRVVFKHKNIELDPSLSRDLNIQKNGEIIVRLGEREKRITQLSETAITDALITLLQGEKRRLVFLSGHGERRALGNANHDLGEFSARMLSVGYQIDTLEQDQALPAAEAHTTLVIASPEHSFSAGEQLALAQYLNQGGHLLWLQDASGKAAAKTLSRLLPVAVLPGIIVDSAAQDAGLPSPDFTLSKHYAAHAALANISGTSLFPRAAALRLDQSSDWASVPLLQSSGKSWNETGEISGNIQPDQHGELTGPLVFAYALQRDDRQQAQRVIVVGDGDFLANNWLGNGANTAVGEQLMSWLTQAQNTPLPPPVAALDRHIEIAPNALLALSLALFLGIPSLLLGVATWQWRRYST